MMIRREPKVSECDVMDGPLHGGTLRKRQSQYDAYDEMR